MVEFDGGKVCLDMIVLVNGNSLLRSPTYNKNS